MRLRLPAVLVVVVFAVAAGIRARPASGEASCEFTGVSRIVAIGDVHGAYDGLRRILRRAGIIDGADAWIGGTTHLVQVGDVVDRGADSRKAIDLYRRLEGEASAAGGQVHYLLGNHEAMRLLGIYTYTTPGEFAAFATDASSSRRDALASSAKPADREAMLSLPLGEIEMAEAFGPSGVYGRYLRSLPVLIHINDVAFVHGGLTPPVASMSCSEINTRIRRELTEDLDKTSADLSKTLSMSLTGPLWDRRLAEDPEDTYGPEVEKILKLQHVRGIVVGHTPQQGRGLIRSRFNGKVFLIDTGMQTDYIATGRPSALEIVGTAITPIYADAHEDKSGATPAPDSPATPGLPAAPPAPGSPSTPVPPTP